MKRTLVSLMTLMLVTGLVGLTLSLGLVPVASVGADSDPVLVARWSFDEGSGNIAYDSSGNNNHGTIYGASWVDGQSAGFGKALSFDGVDDYVDCGKNVSLRPSSAITVEAWVNYGKFFSDSAGHAAVCEGHYYDGTGFMLYQSTGSPYNRVRYYVNATDAGNPIGQSSTLLSTNIWYHLAMVYDGSRVTLYINGVPDSSVITTGEISWAGIIRNLYIGSTYTAGGAKFNGLIDEVRIWGSALSQSQLNDMTPPTITSPNEEQTYLLNQVVIADWTVTDTGTGVKSEVGSIPKGSNLDTSTVGTHTFTVTATDYAMNTYTKTVNYNVGYGFLGLLPPYAAPPKAFKIGSSIPLKWQYTDNDGVVVDSSAANPQIRIVLFSTGFTGEEPILVDDPGNSGLRYDSTTNTWIFNWQTKGWTAGVYNIYITSVQTGQLDGPFPIQLR